MRSCARRVVGSPDRWRSIRGRSVRRGRTGGSPRVRGSSPNDPLVIWYRRHACGLTGQCRVLSCSSLGSHSQVQSTLVNTRHGPPSEAGASPRKAPTTSPSLAFQRGGRDRMCRGRAPRVLGALLASSRRSLMSLIVMPPRRPPPPADSARAWPRASAVSSCSDSI